MLKPHPDPPLPEKCEPLRRNVLDDGSMARRHRQRLQAEELLHKRVEARTREQAALLDISHDMASALELDPGLILVQLRGIIEYAHAGLFGLQDSTLTALAVKQDAAGWEARCIVDV